MKCSSIALYLALVSASAGWAQTPEQQGREVALEANRRASAYGDLSASLLMVIRNGRGGEWTRKLTVTALEVGEAEERVVVRFQAPRDLRGTALLTVNRRNGASDQWLYLPALRRTKRIAGAKQSTSFMGSEFSYEDIGTMEVDRYTYRLIEVDTLDRLSAWVVEQRPKDSSSHYRRQLVWYDKREYRVLRIDFFDRRNTLLKTLTLRNFHRYAGGFWRPDAMEMVNHQTGACTALQWSDYVFGSGLLRRDFEPDRLGRDG